MALCSMTGYGHFQRDDDGATQVWEVRSVNSRYLDPKWRLPSRARAFETRLEKVLRRHAVRGRVEVTLTLQSVENFSGMAFDTSQAEELLRSLSLFAQTRGDDFKPDYTALLSLPQLWTSQGFADDEKFAQGLEQGLALALTDWNKARLAEGADIAVDLRERFSRMETWVTAIEKRAPAIKEERFAQVRERLTETLIALNSNLDDSRFLQEMVIMSDKLDVSEELTRLHSHLTRLTELLASKEDAGRKLDFTLQECFREINTCGNKIQDANISRLVVDFKNELEKCREQVQNLE